MPSVPRNVIDAIESLRAPIMISHVVPDADALGSMLAMALAWRASGRSTMVSIPEGAVSQRLRFMREWAAVPIATSADFASADGFVVTDTAKKPRCCVGPALKETDWSAGRPIVNIDHHGSNTRFGDTNWIIDDAGSSSELVYHLLRAADRPIGPTTASLLLAGIQTDTLGFSTSTTKASALLAAAELVVLGADVGDLGERLFRSQRQSEFDLLRVVYDNTKVAADGQIAYSSASCDEIRDAGCRAADIDEQINVPRSLDGVRLAMLFTEGNAGETRINFRGQGNVTVAGLAAKFKGGGHSQAAGAVVNHGLAESMELVLPAAIEHLKSFDR